MKPVYQAAHGVDAHLVKDLLEQAGIPAQVRGEYLQGALGEIPVSGMVAVWVADAHAEHARQVVLTWEQPTPIPGDPTGPETGGESTPEPGRGHATALIAAVLMMTVVLWTLVRLLA